MQVLRDDRAVQGNGSERFESSPNHPRDHHPQHRDLGDLLDYRCGNRLGVIFEQSHADNREAYAVAAERVQRRRIGLRQKRAAVQQLAEFRFEHDHRRASARGHEPLGFGPIRDQLDADVRRPLRSSMTTSDHAFGGKFG